jgi:hypothetical protein
MNPTTPLQRVPLWLIALIVVLLGLGTSLLMAARAVADGRADSLRAAMLTPPPAQGRLTSAARRANERIADSRGGTAQDAERGRAW